MSDYLTLHTVATFFVALVLGGMTFFSFVMTPLVFRQLGRDAAGPFLAQVFPVYYRVVAALSVLGALPLWYRVDALAMGAVAAASVFAWLFLMPQIERLRPGRLAGEPEATARFRRLHAVSVILNLAQIAVVIVVFFRLIR